MTAAEDFNPTRFIAGFQRITAAADLMFTDLSRQKMKWMQVSKVHLPLLARFWSMNAPLLNKRIAILAADGFEQSELQEPMMALEEAGATVSIVSPNPKTIQGMRHADKGDEFEVDIPLDDAKAAEFDALLLPGGLMNPDRLRSTPAAVKFVRSFSKAGKLIAAICHAPWVLIEAGLVKGLRLTSWPAIQTDVRNAGGTWVDEEVVFDRGIVTSRKPADISAFNAKMIEELGRASSEVKSVVTS